MRSSCSRLAASRTPWYRAWRTFDPKTGARNAVLVGDMKPDAHHPAMSRSPSKPTVSRNETIRETSTSLRLVDLCLIQFPLRLANRSPRIFNQTGRVAKLTYDARDCRGNIYVRFRCSDQEPRPYCCGFLVRSLSNENLSRPCAPCDGLVRIVHPERPDIDIFTLDPNPSAVTARDGMLKTPMLPGVTWQRRACALLSPLESFGSSPFKVVRRRLTCQISGDSQHFTKANRTATITLRYRAELIGERERNHLIPLIDDTLPAPTDGPSTLS